MSRHSWASRSSSVAITVVTMIGTLATAGLTFGAWSQVRSVGDARLQSLATSVAEQIDDRLETTEELLWAIAAAAEAGLDAEGLQGMLEAEQLLERHPANVLTGMAFMVEEGDSVALQLNFGGPVVGNEAAIGRDLLAEPERRRAAETARDSGLETATGITELHVPSKAAMVMMVPAYDRSKPMATTPERRRAFLGVSVAALEAESLLKDLPYTFPSLAIELMDLGPVAVVGAAQTETMVWSTDGFAHDGKAVERDLVAGDRRWRLSVVNRVPALPLLPWVVLLAGLLLTAASVALVRELTTRSDRAEALVSERTAELVSANDALAETDRAKTAFMTNVSHELRTPLTSVLGFAVTLQRMDLGDAPPAVSQFLSRIESNARSLHRMVEELLDFDRVHRPDGDDGPQPIELLGRLTEISGGLYGDVGDRVVTVRGESGVWVDIAEHALDRILMNLLHNADRYCSTQDPVEVVVRVDGPAAIIEVLDRGPGFRGGGDGLFQRFVRGVDAPMGGTGIGLALVRELAREHGGDASLGDRDDGGAWVRVRLPRRDAPVAP